VLFFLFYTASTAFIGNLNWLVSGVASALFFAIYLSVEMFLLRNSNTSSRAGGRRPGSRR